MTHTQVTDRVIDDLRSRGLNITDNRGKLPPNERGLSYGSVPGGLDGVQYLVQHWTGDQFSKETIRAITGTDYNSNTIPDTMTPEDEQELVLWYHRFHQSRDGGVWPGIAYGVLVFPSGRVFWNWDIGTLTYHAFNMNEASFALCCPNSNGAPPTQPQLIALNQIWDVLCNHTPEIPATHAQLFGHKECTFYDSRNQTTCPGTFLPHVQQYRTTGEPTVELTAPDPNKIYFPETGHWLSFGFRAYWEREGGIEKFGYPISEELTENEKTVQYFQRSRFEYQPDLARNPWGVVLGLVGEEAARAARKLNPNAFEKVKR